MRLVFEMPEALFAVSELGAEERMAGETQTIGVRLAILRF